MLSMSCVCSNKRLRSILQARDLDKHVRQECPMELVPCDFQLTGSLCCSKTIIARTFLQNMHLHSLVVSLVLLRLLLIVYFSALISRPALSPPPHLPLVQGVHVELPGAPSKNTILKILSFI
jgi:hypothetical protein